MCHNFIPKYFSYNIMFFLSHILTHTIVFPSQKIIIIIIMQIKDKANQKAHELIHTSKEFILFWPTTPGHRTCPGVLSMYPMYTVYWKKLPQKESIATANSFLGCTCSHTPLIPALIRQRQVDFCEFEASLHNEFQDSQGYVCRKTLSPKTK